MDFVAWDCTKPYYPAEFMRAGITHEQVIALTQESFTAHLCEFIRSVLIVMQKTEREVDVSFSFEDEIGPVPFDGILDNDTWNWAVTYIRRGGFNVDVFFAVSDLQAEVDAAARVEEWRAFAQKRKERQKSEKACNNN